jgi:hypothetical protein
MLDKLIQAALEECARQRVFPPEKADTNVFAWLKHSENRGRCEHGGSA